MAIRPSQRAGVFLVSALLATIVACGDAFDLAPGGQRGSRRDLMDVVTRSVQAAALSTLGINPVAAKEEKDVEIDVYFGCGCFWHVQHELAKDEKRILGRADPLILTARAGYAGGTLGAKRGKVCYHNDKKEADYATLGHAEVVRVRIPPWSFPAFAEEYIRLFDLETGRREDQDGDVGSEYRNLVGVPGGAESPYMKILVDVSKSVGSKVEFTKGFGDDPDRQGLVFVMDSIDFPFYVAEQYHQFHDGFIRGQNYPLAYNRIAEQLASAKTLGVSRCPNGMI